MKILADESIESQIVAALRTAGHDVLDIKEIKPGIEDLEVLSMAANFDSILLTNDKDFGELIYRDKLVSKGVVLLRFGRLEIGEKIEFLITILGTHSRELSGAFTVVTPVGVRIRK